MDSIIDLVELIAPPFSGGLAGRRACRGQSACGLGSSTTSADDRSDIYVSTPLADGDRFMDADYASDLRKKIADAEKRGGGRPLTKLLDEYVHYMAQQAQDTTP